MNGRSEKIAFLCGVIKEGLSNTLTFERPEVSENVSHVKKM